MCLDCDETIKSTQFCVGINRLEAAMETDQFSDKLEKLTDGQTLPICPSNVPFYFSEEYVQGQ